MDVDKVTELNEKYVLCMYEQIAYIKYGCGPRICNILIS